jgi:hypothetical protein
MEILIWIQKPFIYLFHIWALNYNECGWGMGISILDFSEAERALLCINYHYDKEQEKRYFLEIKFLFVFRFCTRKDKC